MNKEVVSDIYEFLKEHEIGLYKDGDEVRAYVIVDYYDLKEFTNVVGSSTFDDGGLEVTMRDGYIVIDLNEIFEGYGHDISNYKNCFNKNDYKLYEKDILKQEVER